MRKYLMIAAMAGAVVSATAALPTRASAMALSAPAGLAQAAADVNQPEKVWCNWRGCWPGPYWGPRPYWGYYRPYGYYYRPWGWRRRWW